MLEVSERALEKLVEFIGEDRQPVRIKTIASGCGCAAAPEVMLTLSELKDNDEVFEIGGITFVVDENLIKEICPIKIDYKVRLTERGFAIRCSGNVGIPG